MRIIVTGGVGYVGRELVRQLSAVSGHELHVVDNLASGEHRLAFMDRDRFRLHVADIRDAEAMRRILGEIAPDLVYHLAAIHYIPQCDREPGNAVAVNVAGTVNLLDAMPRGARFVFASTAAVYAPEADAHDEDRSAVGPMDVYGWTKLHGEQFVRLYTEARSIQGVIVRLFNVVGPGETNPHLAPAIIAQLAEGASRVKLGNLFPHRDYIDVADAAEGFRRIAASAISKAPLCCNLGTGRTHAVRDMVATIAQAAGLDLAIEQDETRVRAVDRPMLKASTRRLEQLTGWRPGITLEESMRRAWATRREDRLQ